MRPRTRNSRSGASITRDRAAPTAGSFREITMTTTTATQITTALRVVTTDDATSPVALDFAAYAKMPLADKLDYLRTLATLDPRFAALLPALENALAAATVSDAERRGVELLK